MTLQVYGPRAQESAVRALSSFKAFRPCRSCRAHVAGTRRARLRTVENHWYWVRHTATRTWPLWGR